MNALSIVLIVASVVLGAFGVVFAIESIKQREGRKRAIGYSVASFFSAVVLGLASTYAYRGYAPAIEPIPADEAIMTAMMSAPGTSGTVA